MAAGMRGYLHGLVGIVIFGLTLPFTRLAVGELDPIFVSVGRTVVAAGAAALLLTLTRQSWPRRRDWLRLLLTAAGVVLGFPILSAIAMQGAPASHGGVVLGVLPLATAVMASIFARERPSAAFWFWSLAGSLTVVLFALWDGGTALQAADTLLVMAVLSAAMGYAVGGDLSRSLGSWQVICWALVAALPVTLPLVLWRLPGIDWSASWPAWGSFLYLSLMSQFLGFFAWNNGLSLGGVAKVGQVQLLQSFVKLGASALLLGETVTLRTFLFALLVAACVWFGRKAKVRQIGGTT